MLRRLFTLLSALSLLVCVVTVVLWVRSYWRVEGITWIGRHPTGVLEGPSRWVGITWGQGAICVVVVQRPVVFKRPGVGWRVPHGPFTAHSQRSTKPPFLQSSSSWQGRLGFGAWRQQLRTVGGSAAGSIDYCYVPLWLVAAATAALPALRARRHIRERSRRLAGCCPSCGYDLRATPRRCPECGTPPAGKDG